MLGDLGEEVARGQALALQAALHVGQCEQHGVHLAPLDLGAQLLERHGVCSSRIIGSEGIGCAPYRASAAGEAVGLNDILQRLESSLGPLTGEPAVLEGGITNRNLRVTLGGVDYVLRRPGKDTGLLGIDREAERLANGDSRKSLEERYTDHQGFVKAVSRAARELVTERFMLEEDANAFISAAQASDVLR